MRKTVLTLLATLPVLTKAYNLEGNRWPDGEATFFVDIPGAAPSGITWNTGLEDAMAQWTEQTPFSFLINNSYINPCEGFSGNAGNAGFPEGGGDSINGADFTDTVCGNEYGQGVLAVTLTIGLPGNLGFALIDQSDIVFNNSYNWDIYTGPRRQAVDFRRVALHELGHALGLDHEGTKPSMMNASISDIDKLQADDIAGANALYGGPGECGIVELTINSVVDDALSDGDCAVQDLYGGGDDTSFVDTYRLNLEQETTISIMMESASLDSVLLMTDEKLTGVDFDDDSAGNCNALIQGTFPAGEYLVLANTYVEPFKCAGNTGNYKISISDNILPILSNARSASGTPSKSIFHGGATSDGLVFKSSFLNSDNINVTASIQADPEHVGQSASLYLLAVLGTGQKLAKNSSGKFKKLVSLNSIPAFKNISSLSPIEEISVVSNLRGDALGVSNLDINIFVGYSLDNDPGEIYFNGKALKFTIE